MKYMDKKIIISVITLVVLLASLYFYSLFKSDSLGGTYYNQQSNMVATLTVGFAGVTKGCLIIEDTDVAGRTYCSALNGTLTCSDTACN